MDSLLYTGSAIIILWGVAHLAATRSVVKGFGDISPDNRRIIIMEWIAEGLTLIFIGALVLRVTPDADMRPVNCAAWWVVFGSSIMLIIMAVLTQLTGARTKVIAIKICPWVKTLVAVLYFLFIIGTTGG